MTSKRSNSVLVTSLMLARAKGLSIFSVKDEPERAGEESRESDLLS